MSFLRKRRYKMRKKAGKQCVRLTVRILRWWKSEYTVVSVWIYYCGDTDIIIASTGTIISLMRVYRSVGVNISYHQRRYISSSVRIYIIIDAEVLFCKFGFIVSSMRIHYIAGMDLSLGQIGFIVMLAWIYHYINSYSLSRSVCAVTIHTAPSGLSVSCHTVGVYVWPTDTQYLRWACFCLSQLINILSFVFWFCALYESFALMLLRLMSFFMVFVIPIQLFPPVQSL